MNNLLSYCGLVDTRISGSEKDFPYLENRNLVFLYDRATVRLKETRWSPPPSLRLPTI